MMSANKDPLEAEVVEFYRGEIRQRYQLERLRELSEFETVDDALLDELRDFFLDHLYPPAEIRTQMDEAFDDLNHLLRSPTRLTPLIKAAIGSMLRLSFHLPAIISTGLATIDAIRETRQLESSLMAVAAQIRPEIEEALQRRRSGAKYRQTMLRLVCGVPEKTVNSLIENVIRLFGALSDVKMLSGMLVFVERCMAVMEKRTDVYTDKDRESMRLCLEVLRGGHSLYSKLKPKDFPKLLKGIDRVEREWYAAVCAPADEAK